MVGAARASAAVLAQVKSVDNFMLVMLKRKESWTRNGTVRIPKAWKGLEYLKYTSILLCLCGKANKGDEERSYDNALSDKPSVHINAVAWNGGRWRQVFASYGNNR